MLRFHVNENPGYRNLTCFGTLDGATIGDLLQRVRELADIYGTSAMVVDLCNAKKDLQMTEIYRVIGSDIFRQLHDMRLALVIEPDFLIPHARALSVLAQNRGISIANFISVEAASDWVTSEFQLAG